MEMTQNPAVVNYRQFSSYKSMVVNYRWGVFCHFHVFLRNNMLEQNVFKITLKSFYDNKVLKNCQLDMLIFVQVYRTIDKNFEIINKF